MTPAVCPRPEKARYPSKKHAKRALSRHRGVSARGAMRAYRCECGAFHLGHKTGSLYRKLKRQGLV